MSEHPILPSQVPNAQSIWHQAGRVIEQIDKDEKIKELSDQLLSIGKGCGDCDKWMKSYLCPKEINVNGFTRGPTKDAPICNLYEENHIAKTRRIKVLDELNELLMDDL